MKKILLIITAIIISANSYSQAKFMIYLVNTANYSEYKQGYVWGERKATNMLITVTEDKIYIDDNAKSIYTFVSTGTKKNLPGGSVISYRAFDERDKDCVLEFVKWDDGTPCQVYVNYSSYSYCYTIKNRE